MSASITDIVARTLSSDEKRIDFRTYGLHGELKRPMFHRFPIKDGISVRQLMIDNITCENSLLKRLMKRGK